MLMVSPYAVYRFLVSTLSIKLVNLIPFTGGDARPQVLTSVKSLKKPQHNAERRSEQSRGILKIADVLNNDNESTSDTTFITTRTPRTLELRALHMLRLIGVKQLVPKE